jgi:hypothetical protein
MSDKHSLVLETSLLRAIKALAKLNAVPRDLVKCSPLQIAYISEERAGFFFGNCLQRDTTKRTQMSTGLHGVLY